MHSQNAIFTHCRSLFFQLRFVYSGLFSLVICGFYEQIVSILLNESFVIKLMWSVYIFFVLLDHYSCISFQSIAGIAYGLAVWEYNIKMCTCYWNFEMKRTPSKFVCIPFDQFQNRFDWVILFSVGTNVMDLFENSKLVL